MYNYFLDFSLCEMEEAYEYFHIIGDYEGCRLVGEAYDENTSLIFN